MFSNLVQVASQWGILVLLARLGGAREVGLFALGLAIVNPIMSFSYLDLNTLQATDAKCQFSFGEYFGFRLVFTVIAVVFIAAVGMVSRYEHDTFVIILLLGIAKAFEAISDIIYGLFQRLECMDRMGKSKILRATLSLGALALGFFFTGRLTWGVFAFAATYGLVLCIYDIPCGAANLPGAEITPVSLLSSLKKYRPEISRKTWQIFRIGFPLGLVAALGALRISIPSYFIERFLGLRELGIFAGINTFLNGFFFMQVAVGTASLPRLAKYNAGGFRRKYWRLALGIVGLGIFVSASLVLVAMFFGETVLELVYGLEYLGFSSLFILLSVVALLKCVGGSLQFILASMRIFSYHLPVTSVGVFTNFLFPIIWIPVYGLSAAAYAMIIGSFVIMLLYLFAILRSELSNKVSIHESRSQIH